MLETVEAGATDDARGSVIWLHGLGADGHDFEPIVPELGLAGHLDLRFVFPHAPVREVTINAGIAMRAWYDIVTLDRVICCYPGWRRLVSGSASKARRLYAFSLPRDRWYLRFGVRLINFSRWLVGSAFRAFVHPVADVDRMLEEMGFRQVLVEHSFVWRVEIYETAQGTTRRDA